MLWVLVSGYDNFARINLVRGDELSIAANEVLLYSQIESLVVRITRSCKTALLARKPKTIET